MKKAHINWSTYMSPEHVDQLRKGWKNDERVTNGTLSKEQAIEIDFKLQRALNDDLTVSIKQFDQPTASTLKLISIVKETQTLYGINPLSRSGEEINILNITHVTIE